MTRVAELGAERLAQRLRDGGLDIRMGPFSVRVHCALSRFAHWFGRFYAEQRLADGKFADFHVSVQARRGLRRWYRPQSVFSADGFSPFHPLPLHHAVPSFEWGLNWCIATRAHRYLIFHAAVLERGGHALVMPGEPGAGKSTLCAALAHRGWRLLSDELGLLCLDSGELFGLARPINIKNESIAAIREFAPTALLSDECHNTAKGTVALVCPPAESVRRVQESARARWVVTPQFQAAAAPLLETHSTATSFMELAHNSFNYSILGTRGFDALASMMDCVQCHHFRYSRLQDATRVFDRLAGDS